MSGGNGGSYVHWVTLFDDLDDDVFDGQLGVDDYDLPRILVEYTVVGGSYTSIMNNIDSIRTHIDRNRSRSKQRQLGHHQAQGGAEEEDYSSDGGDSNITEVLFDQRTGHKIKRKAAMMK
jgi:hypothetical protein